MNIPPRSKTHRITSDVREHLLEAFQHTIAEFFANAHGGQTPAQRAAEIRAGDRDRGLDSLLQLVDMDEGDTEQAETVAGFLAGLYNGTDYRFDLTALRAPDDDLFEHCLTVLRPDRRPTFEVHGYFPGGDRRCQQIITRWNPDKYPTPEQAPVQDEGCRGRYVTNQKPEGCRAMTRVATIEGGSICQRPVELHSPSGVGAYSRDLIKLNHGTCRPREWRGESFDMKEGELRPQWLQIPGAHLMRQ